MSDVINIFSYYWRTLRKRRFALNIGQVNRNRSKQNFLIHWKINNYSFAASREEKEEIRRRKEIYLKLTRFEINL